MPTTAAAEDQAAESELSPLVRVIGTSLVFGGLALALPVVVETAERDGPDGSPELLGPGIVAGAMLAGGIPMWIVGGLPAADPDEPASATSVIVGPTGGWLRCSF